MTAIISHPSEIAADFLHKKQHSKQKTTLESLAQKSWDVADFLNNFTTEPNEKSAALRAYYSRLERYVLQRWIRHVSPDLRTSTICLRHAKPDMMQHYETQERGKQLLWLESGDFAGGVPIYQSPHGSTFYGNLQVCGSVWNCPVCAAKISERRRDELKRAVDQYSQSGGILLMVTRTVPHDRFNDIDDLLARFKKAEETMKRQTSYKGNKKSLGLKNQVGLIGTITALEVTYGFENGWHPHTHELWFLENPKGKTDQYTDLQEFKDDYEGLQNYIQTEMHRLWSDATKKLGFKPLSKEHGVTVVNADYALEYILKFGREPKNLWTIDAEMTQYHRKNSVSIRDLYRKKEPLTQDILKKVGSLTPWDIIRLGLYFNVDQSTDLFKQYTEAFKRRRQLRWSKGLKQHFNIQEKTDEQLAEEKKDKVIELTTIDYNTWDSIVKEDARGVILGLARHLGAEAVTDFITDVF